MRRRSFLKMLGLAPVATALTVDAAIPDEVSVAPTIEGLCYTSEFGTVRVVPGHIHRAYTKALLDEVMLRTYGP